MAHNPKHKTKKDKLELQAEELQKRKSKGQNPKSGEGKSKGGQLPKSKSKSPAKMKTNQDGGSYTAKKPSAAAKELKRNQEGAAKMGYQQKFGAARMSPSKRGDKVASELMHGAGKYYDGAGMYMNGAPKYEGAGKYSGPMDAGHGGSKGHTHGQINLDNVNVTGQPSMASEKQDLLELIKARNQYDKTRRTEVLPKLAEIDSLKMVASGDHYGAKEMYGQKYDASKATRLPYSVTQEKRKELSDKALQIQGPRPGLKRE